MPTVTFQQAFEQAMQHHQAGQLKEAEALYRQILAAQPHHGEALHYLGLIAHQAGRYDLAAEWIGQAVVLRPTDFAAHFSLGEACRMSGRLDEAIATFRRALLLKPDSGEAYNNLGLALWKQGRFDEAAAAYRRAVELQPGSVSANSNLGDALREQGHFAEAVDAYRRAIKIKPASVELHNNLGAALRGQGHLDKATAAFRRAIECQPDYAEAHNNLGHAYYDQGHLDEAVAALHRAIQLRPDYPEAHSNLGAALTDQGSIDEAIAALRQAIQFKPDCAEAHHNLGAVLKAQGCFTEALSAYRRALQIRPDSADTNWNISLLLLLRGDFEHGWPLYEARWNGDDLKDSKRDFPQALWHGEALAGQRVLLHAEQGLGDTLQFIRYAPLVAERGGHVIVECQPGLKKLLAGTHGISQIFERGEPLPPFDLHCPLMSLPLAFGTRVETIPAAIPYLRAEARQTARWRDRLEEENHSAGAGNPEAGSPLKIGLVWAGGQRPHQPRLRAVDRRRSLRLSQFASLATVPGVIFVSLQKGPPAAQTETPPEGMRLLDWTEELGDFAATAALVEALDLVITVDTAVAHLAGALGKPVWLLNRFDTCWRWFTEREDSPWYPTMRLFRQPRYRDWAPVLANVREQLALLAAAPPRI